MATLTPPRQINARGLVSLAPVAGLIAAVVNAVLFLIGTFTGAIPTDLVIPDAGQPLTVIPVIVASFFPALVAGLGLAVLNRFTKNPLRIFNILTLAILLFSFTSPLSIPKAPAGMIVLLELMHVVVVGIILYLFNRYGRNRMAG